ncbi:Rieske (2Fe-2S) protein [Natrinema versiforme]|uniref:Rieske (2Fe-2S) iron-sulfur domain-containing protein n=1 Tax=Natrinema versiforme JCM 10478 TaxID=1227496 RepID=L9XP02_9EURY|nr:Rieske (2Fe-2S) protein [Natrinema versiforme]ELY63287.1 Rieske (2Fe-2S) iron-sulfur domain-containing protein [Natrinema versiforme JCM 10478]
MGDHTIAAVDELEDGDRKLVEVEGREIALFRVNGDYHAYTNWCAHQGGPACEGSVTGTAEATFERDDLTVSLDWCKEGEVLNCPWHGWEYDIPTGDCLSKDGTRLPSHPVRVENGSVVVSL